MNFVPATVSDGTAHLPMADVPLPPEVRDRLGNGNGHGTRNLIAGIRPEDFEDAERVDGDIRGRGATFASKLDLVEAMGAEYYAHFGVDAQQVKSRELDDLREDAGDVAELTDGGETVLVARLSPKSRARTGDRAELWMDSTKLHFFDGDSGLALTHRH